jgi:hypothetical protein
MKAGDMKLLKKFLGDVEQMIDTLTPVRDGWQDAYDVKSEKWQESDKGEKLQERINSLSSALDNLESAKDDLGEAAQEDE